ncbi:hypothetical protein C5167_042432, partial [Papaver somniferum]
DLVLSLVTLDELEDHHLPRTLGALDNHALKPTVSLPGTSEQPYPVGQEGTHKRTHKWIWGYLSHLIYHQFLGFGGSIYKHREVQLCKVSPSPANCNFQLIW